MARLACVDVPELPLQLLLQRQPDWAGQPVAVVAEDRPNGVILWVDERARQARVRPGQRYAAGLALAAGLRAGVVDDGEVAAAVDRLTALLRELTPSVEPAADAPGVFWLDAAGLAGLWPSASAWARAVHERVQKSGFRASVAVGFDRFATLALARMAPGRIVVARTPADERQRSDRVPVDRLRLAPKVHDVLARLGVADVGAFRRLPPGSLLERFGHDADRVHRLARGELPDPLVPSAAPPVLCERFELDPECPAIDSGALLFVLKQRLARLCAALAAHGQAVAALSLRLVLDRAPPRDETVRPAAPTLDEVQLVDLLRLRLEALSLGGAVVGFELAVEPAVATRAQLELFAQAQRRDLAAANRALARLRAELGDDAVVCAVLRDGHLPEAGFTWQRLARLARAAPGECGTPQLVRRVLARPMPLAHERPDRDGWLAGGLANGPVERLHGPYVVSGGWWQREQHREYWFAETRSGAILWLFEDRRRRRWFRHGHVE